MPKISYYASKYRRIQEALNVRKTKQQKHSKSKNFSKNIGLESGIASKNIKITGKKFSISQEKPYNQYVGMQNGHSFGNRYSVKKLSIIDLN